MGTDFRNSHKSYFCLVEQDACQDHGGRRLQIQIHVQAQAPGDFSCAACTGTWCNLDDFDMYVVESELWGGSSKFGNASNFTSFRGSENDRALVGGLCELQITSELFGVDCRCLETCLHDWS